MGYQIEPVCVFCDRKQFEERLCGETDDFWIIATLGQITDGGYLLLVPKRHVLCVGAMTKLEIEAFSREIHKIRCSLYEEYNLSNIDEITVFEHGIVGQTVKHAHFHFIPKLCNITERVRKDFPQSEVVNMESGNLDELRKLYRKNKKPYLIWKDDEPIIRICLNPPAPLMYLRIITAKALGVPERGNWRQMDPELDKKLWSETVKKLKPYFDKK